MYTCTNVNWFQEEAGGSKIIIKETGIMCCQVENNTLLLGSSGVLRMSRGDSGYKGTVPLCSISTDPASLHLKTAKVLKKKNSPEETYSMQIPADILYVTCQLSCL